jgi:hypothetical protein
VVVLLSGNIYDCRDSCCLTSLSKNKGFLRVKVVRSEKRDGSIYMATSRSNSLYLTTNPYLPPPTTLPSPNTFPAPSYLYSMKKPLTSVFSTCADATGC